MTTDPTRTWSPSWDGNVMSATRSIGFSTLTDLLGSLPCLPYSDVAELLGKSVAPIQVIAIQFREASANGIVRSAAMDCLSRNIVEQFPEGWGTGANADWRATKALSNWSSAIIATADRGDLELVLDNVMDALSNVPPPTGWIPLGANDPIIVAIFNEHYPSSLK